MTDGRDDYEDELTDEPETAGPPARAAGEGVRILGAEEAQAALEAGAVGKRLGDHETRYGDVPPRPDPAIRPAARFPRTTEESDEVLGRVGNDDEDVQDEPADDVAHFDPFGVAEGVVEVPVVPPAAAPPVEEYVAVIEPVDPDQLDFTIDATAGDEHRVTEPRSKKRGVSGGVEIGESPDVSAGSARGAGGEEAADEPLEVRSALDEEARDEAARDEAAPDEAATDAAEPDVLVSGSGAAASLPHWSEPPTGEIPVLLPESGPVDLTGEHDADALAAAIGPRFRVDAGEWNDDEISLIDVVGEGDGEPGEDSLRAGPDDDEDEVFARDVRARRQPRSPRPERGGGPRGPRRAGRLPLDADGTKAGGSEPPPDVTTRVVTGVAVAVLALVCLTLGREATMVLATLVVLLASLELFQGFRQRGFRPATALAVLGSVAIVPLAYDRGEFAFPFVMALVTVFTLLWYLIEVVRARPVVNVAVTVFGFMYIGGLGGFAGLLLSYQNGVGLILGLALCAVAYDVVGYFVGSQFGKSRLAPAISPNKTWEGLIGGMTAAFIVALLIVNRITPWNNLGDAFALGVTVAIVAPLGDLCESMLKRDLGVKDLGNLLPGHGGVLDRFDAVLFCLPAVYYLARALTIG